MAPVAKIPQLIPQPSEIRMSDEKPFEVKGVITILCPTSCAFEGKSLADLLKKAGAKARVVSGSDIKATVTIDDSAMAATPAGSYGLNITTDQIKIEAHDTAGAFYAVQTIRQLLPAEIERGPISGAQIPSLSIQDEPKLAWRGLLLDVSRHFFTIKEVKHVLDLLAMQKMNVFHWHLTDDGGWRIEIKHYPNLTKQGAWRKPIKEVWSYVDIGFPEPELPGKRYGGFYTQNEVRDVIRYAAARHITIVPEIEMPGHCMAAMASYPELGCSISNADYTKASGMPYKTAFCAGKDSTFQFLENVLDEVIDLFPSQTIHIGGDEVDKYLWNHCLDCKKRMTDEHLADAEELQSYFVKRIEKHINARGRRLMGWDEILQGGLAPNAQVMSWRGTEGGITAAKANHDVVMTPTSHCYFDYTYGQISTNHVLGFEPVPTALVGTEGASRVLGGQCNLWTEWVADIKTAEQRLFPRMLAMSEVLWSKETSVDSFNPRLNAFYPRLQALSLNFFLPKPEAEFDAVVMDPEAKIAFQPTPIPGSTIRYTTDGSIPTTKSTVYTGPISAAKPQMITAATFLNGGQQSDPTHIEVTSQSTASIEGLKPGFAYTIYSGSFSKMPDFSKLKAAASGEAPNVGLVGDLKKDYAISMDGVITVPKSGVYRFFLKSDDGSVFWLGGARVVDNDGLHGAIEQSGRIYLKAGSYPVRAGFFQADGGQSFTLMVEGPDLPKQIVPADWIRH